MIQTEEDLPKWFNTEEASQKIWDMHGGGFTEDGSLLRFYFVQFNMDAPKKSNSAYIWALMLPNKEVRFLPDPADLQTAFGLCILRGVELKTFDIEYLPDEIMQTIYAGI